MSNKNQLKMHKKKRDNILAEISRFEQYLTTFNDDFVHLKFRLEKCQTLFTQFEDVQLQIELIEEDADHTLEHTAFESMYYEVIAKDSAILDLNVGRNTNIREVYSPIASVRFPKINWPTFSGVYDEFMSFYDSFKGLIHHNPSLSDVERFHYLRSSLTGDAAQVISGLETTAENYHSAWTLLVERYDNKRLAIHNHVKALFDLLPMQKESYISIRQLLDNLNKHLRALESFNEPIKHWDTLLIFLMCTKLDNISRREWEITVEKFTDVPKTKDFTDFLNRRASLLETISTCKKPSNNVVSNISKPHKYDRNLRDQSQSYFTLKACIVCQETHKFTTCNKFLELPPKSRFLEIKKHKLCTLCLKGGHTSKVCTTNVNCSVCNKKHHLLLHFDDVINTVDGNESDKVISAHSTFKDNEILLSTAIIDMLDHAGRLYECKVLLDSGSQSNFITKNLCDRLKLSKRQINMAISGLGQNSMNVHSKVNAVIKSKSNGFTKELDFLVVDKITDNLSVYKVNFDNVIIPNNIKLADPCCNIPSKIDTLLGASIFWSLLCVGQIKLYNSHLIAHKTKLGWIISGHVNKNYQNRAKSHCHFSSNIEIQNQLENFWKIEHCENRHFFSKEEQACENSFVSTHIREKDGRFAVRLPLRHDLSKLGESKNYGIKTFFVY